MQCKDYNSKVTERTLRPPVITACKSMRIDRESNQVINLCSISHSIVNNQLPQLFIWQMSES